MKFTITFHEPFRVATGRAHHGLDDTVDPDNPLPASSLKGLMRAHATHLLDIHDALVNEVFGSPANRSPWWWSDATIDTQVELRIRTRLAIDATTHTAAENALFTAGELWPHTASFRVERRGPADGIDLDLHEIVLAASAQAITALGSDRRRGLGWVGITSDRSWSPVDTRTLQTHRGHDA